MKTYEQRPNSGVLFSTRAKKHPKAPDYFGNILIDLSMLEVKDNKVEVKLSGWKKESSSGATFLSLTVDTYNKEKSNDEDIPF